MVILYGVKMLDSEQRQQVTYFVGVEVEHTPLYGKPTLFVVGTPPVEDIVARAHAKHIDHVYLGTSRSFNPATLADWAVWTQLIEQLLESGLWVTLDFDYNYVDNVATSSYSQHKKFVPMISLKTAYAKLFNPNLRLRIQTQDGVHNHSIGDIMQQGHFTAWDEYLGDQVID